MLSRLVNIKKQIENHSFCVLYAGYHLRYTIPNLFLCFWDGFYLEIHYVLKGNRHLTKLLHSMIHFEALTLFHNIILENSKQTKKPKRHLQNPLLL